MPAHLLADNTMAAICVNWVGWVLLCTTGDSYEIGYGTDANIRLCSQQFICWDNKIHWQAISTDIFRQSEVEQSGQFMIHSLIQLIFEEKDYLSVNLFVADKNKKCRFFFIPEDIAGQVPLDDYSYLGHAKRIALSANSCLGTRERQAIRLSAAKVTELHNHSGWKVAQELQNLSSSWTFSQDQF